VGSVVVHAIIGFVLVTSWRRTGNLAAPGIAHAVIDALRNAVAMLSSNRRRSSAGTREVRMLALGWPTADRI
jgi:membrane protease YdiL (CAAX protease family)